VRGSRSIELARLKKKEKHLARFASSWFGSYFGDAFSRHCRGVLLVMKTLEDEWYVVTKAYKLAVFEILGDFFLYCHILRVRAVPTLESTDTYDIQSPPDKFARLYMGCTDINWNIPISKSVLPTLLYHSVISASCSSTPTQFRAVYNFFARGGNQEENYLTFFKTVESVAD